MKYCLFFFLTIFFTINIYADFIKLNNNQTSNTTILDTNNCEVTILRNNKAVGIKKNLIDFIVIKGDTINYKNYKCEKKPNQKNVIQTKNDNFTNKNIIIYKKPENLISQKESKKQITKKKVKIALGVAQILIGITTEVLTIYDANRTISIETSDEKLKYKNDWNIGHTILALLGSSVIISGVVTIAF